MGPCYSGYSAIVTIDIKIIADKWLFAKAVPTLPVLNDTVHVSFVDHMIDWLIDCTILRFGRQLVDGKKLKLLGCFRAEY